jgi:NADH-quinone oxidoreductase subunit L
MRKMGGLKSHMPATYWTYVIATLAIAGAPFTAGFFSKDLILWQAYSSAHGSPALWLIAWLTAGMTAFYMFRQLFMVFHGGSRADPRRQAHLHESPAVMTVPLMILAVGSIFSGWLGAPEYLWGSRWDHWLEPVFRGAHEVHHGAVETEITLMALTLVIVAAGIALAYVKYGRPRPAVDQGAGTGGILYRISLNKYYVDEIYDGLLVRPFTLISDWLARVFDPGVIDGIVNGVGAGARDASSIWRALQTGNVQHYVMGILAGTLALLVYYLRQW